ncbi:N-terminal phage integrase SAM-like domain-containing protein [Marasmitruncus massiliensis]|uniref:N-terminal phage integrase SAM-like domain-containing protein n=1 Tax=Marasmitruncus massiliensis TaxID=1944642 RepID=UPI000C7AE79D|nr:N-terminal phage integrase SAM-like domain-containing protein [Marasmitruncus massiliensis]
MTGSLQTKNGKYFVVLSYKDFSGKWKQKWVGTGLEAKGDKRRATEFMPQIVGEHAQMEVYLAKGEILFADFLKYWLESKRDKIELSTWEGYKVYTEKHTMPYFRSKGLTLTELSPRHFVDYYNYEF